jgi:hypothetical protein
VERALGAEAILLRPDTGAEVSADPLKIRLPEIMEPIGPLLPPIDELRYSAAAGSAATRRAMIATSGASVSGGETAGGRLSPVFAALVGSVMITGPGRCGTPPWTADCAARRRTPVFRQPIGIAPDCPIALALAAALAVHGPPRIACFESARAGRIVATGDGLG